MIDGARETLRWLRARMAKSSPLTKTVYIIIICLVCAVAVYTLPVFRDMQSYFAKANPATQTIWMAFLFTSAVVGLICSYERTNRVMRLKSERRHLKRRLKASEQVNEQLENRWNSLVAVESRENIWQRPTNGSATPFINASNRKTRFISVLNLKGGVGKTTLTGNIAACLGLGASPLRILLVDADFQGTLSDVTVDPQLVQLQTTSGNTVSRLLNPSSIESVEALATPMASVPGAKVILATDQLEQEDFRLQAEFFVRRDREVRFLFRERLHTEKVFHRYDLVLFDCPPRLTTSAINALACSDYVLIPTKLDPGSVNAVPRTIQWLDALSAVVPARLLGVVANQTNRRGDALTRLDETNYNYLCSVVSQSRAGNPGFVFKSSIKADNAIIPRRRGLVAAVDAANRELFTPFISELRSKIQI